MDCEDDGDDPGGGAESTALGGCETHLLHQSGDAGDGQLECVG